MNEITNNYKELFAEIERLKLTQTKLLDEKNLLYEERLLMTWHCTHFNENTNKKIKEKVTNNDGFKILLSNQNHKENLRLVKKSLLYSDLILILSGGPIESIPENITNQVGTTIAGITDWYKDLMSLKTLLLSDYGICVPRNYFLSENPEKSDWEIVGFKSTISESTDKDKNKIDRNSLYYDLYVQDRFKSVLCFDNQEQINVKKIKELHNINELTINILTSMNLPFIDNIPLETLIKIRNENYDSFHNFRYTMKSIISDCLKFDNDDSLIKEFSSHIKSTYIDPELTKLEQDLRRIKRNRILTNFNVKIKTLSVLINFLSMNVLGLVSDALQLSETQTQQKERQNGLMLLWDIQNTGK